jgi:ribosomal protein L35
MKTNKSFSKRIRVTKKGKLVVRKAGQNHFNARERTARSLDKRRTMNVTMNRESRARFLPGS